MRHDLCESYLNLVILFVAEMAPKTKPDAKPKAEKGKKAPAPKKVDASKKEAKDGKAPVKAVQKALKVCLKLLLT